MTEPLYLQETDRRRFSATVERRLDDRVVLDRTCFYPEGGGQPADRGRLIAVGDGGEGGGDDHGGEGDAAGSGDGADDRRREWTVEDVQKRDTVYHHLDETGPPEGTTVEGVLDWDRRRAHMRYHTAQHLLSALLLAEFDAPTTGNQLYADRARIDVEYDRFEDDDLRRIDDRMNDLIDRAMDVRWYEMDRERAERELDTDRTRIDLLPDSIQQLRIVEIGPEDDPYDRTACAGTHVSTTAGVGRFRLTGRETKGEDEERLRFELAD